MKKFNALTLAFVFAVTVVVALAGFIATRPLASNGQGGPGTATLAIPF